MGYYIEVPANTGKAELIRQLHGGEILPGQPEWNSWAPGKACIVVVANALFEAAAYAYDEQEFRAFTDPSDDRPRQFVLMDRELAEKLSGRAR